jgi:NTE family protein
MNAAEADVPTTRAPETATSRDVAYVPDRHRSGVALCLSGGGSRAALFHLGVVRRLNELGLLSAVDTITGVSGGSIFAAHLAAALPPRMTPGSVIPEFDVRVRRPFEKFCRRNLRTPPIARRVLMPWNWGRDQTQVSTLARLFATYLNPRRLADLPERPNYVFCASDNAYGVNWTFSRRAVGDYEAGFGPPGGWSVAAAVAASACFPPVFAPMDARATPEGLVGGLAPAGPERDAAIRGLRLSDGGLYDNLALEPVWKDHAVVIVSDGGATFDVRPDAGGLTRLKRYATIMGRQTAALRKRWLIGSFVSGVMQGTYMGIGTPVARYEIGTPGYSAQLVSETIAEVRTDLDRFSDAEIAVLQNHGYLVAEAAVKKHLTNKGLSIVDAELEVPYSDWLDELRVAEALVDSSQTKMPFGRGPWLRYLGPQRLWPAR